MKNIITLCALCCTLTAFAQVPSYVPTNGLVGWWPFNGDATDQSTNGNDGTVNGANLTTDRNSKGASACLFDGNNDFINCGNILALQGATALTLAAWVNIDTKSGSARIISNEYHVTNDEGARI